MPRTNLALVPSRYVTPTPAPCAPGHGPYSNRATCPNCGLHPLNPHLSKRQRTMDCIMAQAQAMGNPNATPEFIAQVLGIKDFFGKAATPPRRRATPPITAPRPTPIASAPPATRPFRIVLQNGQLRVAVSS